MVLTTMGLTSSSSYNQGSYNQRFLQPLGLGTRGLITRGLTSSSCFKQGFLRGRGPYSQGLPCCLVAVVALLAFVCFLPCFFGFPVSRFVLFSVLPCFPGCPVALQLCFPGCSVALLPCFPCCPCALFSWVACCLVALVALCPFLPRCLFALVALVPCLPGGLTPIHYLYGYVPPNGVVILKLLKNGVSISGAFSRTGYNISNAWKVQFCKQPFEIIQLFKDRLLLKIRFNALTSKLLYSCRTLCFSVQGGHILARAASADSVILDK